MGSSRPAVNKQDVVLLHAYLGSRMRAPSEAASFYYSWRRGISMGRIPEMRVVPTFVESRQSDIDEQNNHILSCAGCESPALRGC